ncbi:hypothetical protein pb186bvf_002827 [Paramecium bursaria]
MGCQQLKRTKCSQQPSHHKHTTTDKMQTQMCQSSPVENPHNKQFTLIDEPQQKGQISKWFQKSSLSQSNGNTCQTNLIINDFQLAMTDSNEINLEIKNPSPKIYPHNIQNLMSPDQQQRLQNEMNRFSSRRELRNKYKSQLYNMKKLEEIF